MLNALTFTSFVSFGTHIFDDKTLELPVHISKLIINGQYLSSTGFKLIRVGLTMHGSTFEDRHLVGKDSIVGKDLIIQ